MTLTLVEALDKYTVDLVLDADVPPAPRGAASGVILPKGAELVVVTAGHILSRGNRWFLERKLEPAMPGVLIPLNGITSLLKLEYRRRPSAEVVDIAWATIDQARLVATMRERHEAIALELPV